MPGGKLVQGHIYGRTPDRELALRSFTDGKMKVSTFNGTDYPPLLTSIQQDFPNFTMNVPSTIEIDTTANATSDKNFFAVGDPRFNMHLGHLYWATRALQLHNSLCDLVMDSEPTYTDQQVFETSRLILSHYLIKIIVEEYVGQAISPFRDMAGIKYDPDVMRAFSYPTLQNRIYLEFDHLYRWHSLIPDVLNLGQRISFPDVVFQPQLLLDYPLEQITSAFINTSAGSMTAQNIPLYLYPITIQTMLDARAQHLQGFNAYRQAFELPKFTSFEDFGLNASLTSTLSKLYNNDVDQVEWFVGLMIESPAMGASFLAETMVSAVATFAISAIWNTDLVKNPLLWTSKRMTAAGKAWVEATTFQDILGVNLEVPFFMPDRQPDWQTVDGPRQWNFSNLPNFVGRDYAVSTFFSSGGDFHMLFNTTLMSAVGVILVFVLINCFWKCLGKRTIFLQLNPETQLIVTVHSALAVITTLQLVPYTVFVLPTWFGPDFLGQLESRYTVLFTFFIVHGIMYICEATTRAVVKTSQLLLWHHALWFIFIFIASVKRSVFAIKLDFILDYFVCWEFALYIVLL
ncbi:TPA: Prostaglandin G/H synthase 1 [Trebouxia sp. C0006]